jgi:uncharacterized protein with GYD domain
MWFVTLVKFRQRPTKEDADKVTEYWTEAEKWHPGFKVHHSFWTLGRYDVVTIIEASDEKTAMRVLMWNPIDAVTETMVAVTRDEAIKWLSK